MKRKKYLTILSLFLLIVSSSSYTLSFSDTQTQIDLHADENTTLYITRG